MCCLVCVVGCLLLVIVDCCSLVAVCCLSCDAVCCVLRGVSVRCCLWFANVAAVCVLLLRWCSSLLLWCVV